MRTITRQVRSSGIPFFSISITNLTVVCLILPAFFGIPAIYGIFAVSASFAQLPTLDSAINSSAAYSRPAPLGSNDSSSSDGAGYSNDSRSASNHSASNALLITSSASRSASSASRSALSASRNALSASRNASSASDGGSSASHSGSNDSLINSNNSDDSNDSGGSGGDSDFQLVEDSQDTWFWNAGMIKSHHKADGTWTYYQAPRVYSYLEVKWEPQSRTAAYFLDGNRISAQEALVFARPGTGFPVGSKTPVGDPRFSLSASHSSPSAASRQEKKVTIPLSIPGLERLRNRYRQKYAPDLWQFTALAVTRHFVWVGVRSIPHPPEPMPGFRQPDGSLSGRHFRESSILPIQGGILRINKDTGEWVRFTEKTGLPESLICHPLRGEAPYLPHFLASRRGGEGQGQDHGYKHGQGQEQEHGQGQGQGQEQEQGQGYEQGLGKEQRKGQEQGQGHDHQHGYGQKQESGLEHGHGRGRSRWHGREFAQEVIMITPLMETEEGDTGRVRVCFTTRAGQKVWYDERQEIWETGNIQHETGK
ncbi:MAG: hypothetical protein AB1847_19270 [bacterium]